MLNLGTAELSVEAFLFRYVELRGWDIVDALALLSIFELAGGHLGRFVKAGELARKLPEIGERFGFSVIPAKVCKRCDFPMTMAESVGNLTGRCAACQLICQTGSAGTG